MRLLFTGGGTGGHIFPLIAIARELRKLLPAEEIEFFYLGPNKPELELILLSQEGFNIKTISSGKIRRYLSFENFKDILFKIPIGILQSLFYLLRFRPALVFSKGGYGSFPVTISALFLGIPVFLHESDITPGLANRVASKWAKKIFISFQKTEYFSLKKTTFVGNPIMREILNGNKQRAKEIFNLTFEKPIILILGGSQGAQTINDFILRILNEFLKDFELIHQCGINHLKSVKAEAQVIIEKELEKYYHPIGFLREEKLKHALAAADLIISRAGSGAIFEIAAVGKPSILIPLTKSAGNHQAKNAYRYFQAGACQIIEEGNLKPNFFLEKVKYIFFHKDELEKMKENALKFSKPESARIIAREILEYIMEI